MLFAVDYVSAPSVMTDRAPFLWFCSESVRGSVVHSEGPTSVLGPCGSLQVNLGLVFLVHFSASQGLLVYLETVSSKFASLRQWSSEKPGFALRYYDVSKFACVFFPNDVLFSLCSL